MKEVIKYGLLLLLMLVSTSGTLHAETDTVQAEKRLIDELTTQPKFVRNIYASSSAEYIAKSMRYPPQARENGIEGKVWIRFMIDENGNVTDISLAQKRNLGGGLEQEALRVVKTMPAWQPATYNGKAVRVVYTLPVYFKLE